MGTLSGVSFSAVFSRFYDPFYDDFMTNKTRARACKGLSEARPPEIMLLGLEEALSVRYRAQSLVALAQAQCLSEIEKYRPKQR